jgi:hypothetical protein
MVLSPSFPPSFPAFLPSFLPAFLPVFLPKMPQCVALKPNGAQCTQTGAPAHNGLCGIHHNQKMRQCVALKSNGAQCTHSGAPAHNGLCGIHHNQKMRKDPAYAARFPTIVRVPGDEQLEVPPQLHEQIQLLVALLQQQMVVARDPEGGVDLRAFGEDKQSVHRSSVQSMAETGLKNLLDSVPEPLPSLEAVCDAVVRHMKGQAIGPTIENVHKSYSIMSAFDISYKLALDCLWARIQAHKHRDELERRLVEELHESIGMCSNGQMARLVNVLQGYDESAVPVLSRDAFQTKMAMLATLPMGDREPAAHEAFAEYAIPAEEQGVWLETLLEA